MAAGLRTIVLAGLVVGGINGFVFPDLKLADVLSIRDRLAGALGPNAEPLFDAIQATAIAKRDPSNADTGLTRTLTEPEARRTASSDPPEVLAPEAPVRLAALTPLDQVHADTNEASNGVKPPDECPVPEICIDQYLWSLYQRAPKVDTVKVVEQQKVPVIKKGKLQTLIKKLAKLVREDFAWKDPKAAEKAGMPLMEYVIGGMDRSFKLRLYHALRAMDDAGLAPGITSAFRDDYRQSLASGLKAATERSYHGGSFRGGYGHGLAVDLVSVNGETGPARWSSSEKLWKWIDEHGKDFGIGRPYLDKDPAHVAPIDGKVCGPPPHREGATPAEKTFGGSSRTLILSKSRKKRRRPRPKHRILRLCSSCRSRPRWSLPWSAVRLTRRQPGCTKQESAPDR